MEIRTLKPNEIEARVQIIKDTGCSLLLYKDARCDMKILDEVFGPLGWKRKHEVIGNNLYCTVSIFDKENKQWIDKQDVGTESFTQKEKGQASDSFKRACFNIGIGRELYTAPFIWIKLNKGEVYNNKGKLALDAKLKFEITEIDYSEDKEITYLVIKDNKGTQRFVFGNRKQVSNEKQVVNEKPVLLDRAKVETLTLLAKQIDADLNKTLEYYNVKKVEDLNVNQFTQIVNQMKKKKVE